MSSRFDEMRVFSGTGNLPLAHAICERLGILLGDATVTQFSNQNIFVKLNESIREKDVFVVQSLSLPLSDAIMELLIMLDACRRASAGRVTAVIPYYAYGRTDKKDQPRVPITARLLADMIQVAGAQQVITLDLHAGQMQGFFTIPLDELTAMPLLVRHFAEKGWDDATGLMRAYLDESEFPSDKIRLRLAEVLIRRLDRPVAGTRVLEGVAEAGLAPPLAEVRRRLIALAEQMIEEGVLEIDDEARGG